MRRFVVVMAMAVLVMGLLGTQALAHNLGPCNDGVTSVSSVADGATGHNYATHHIVAAAKAGALGAGGHIPGTHQGFSVCNPSGG